MCKATPYKIMKPLHNIGLLVWRLDFNSIAFDTNRTSFNTVEVMFKAIKVFKKENFDPGYAYRDHERFSGPSARCC